MSYSYPYTDQYSPSSPRDSFPSWEVLDPSPQGLMGLPSPLTPLQTPLYGQQHLQLESDASVHSQCSSPEDSVLLQHVPQDSRRHDASATQVPSPSTGGRTTRRSTPPRVHPYTRPESAVQGSSSNSNRVRKQQNTEQDQSGLRFIQHLPPPPSTAPRSSMTPPATVPPTRFLTIRVDWRYDPATRKIMAYFEMPGIRREDVRITLTTTYYNRVKQVTVRAMRHAPFRGATSREPVPGREFCYIEGKYGECRRSISVSSECKPEDIDAQLDDGVLVLRINCGTPEEKCNALAIPLR